MQVHNGTSQSRRLRRPIAPTVLAAGGDWPLIICVLPAEKKVKDARRWDWDELRRALHWLGAPSPNGARLEMEGYEEGRSRGGRAWSIVALKADHESPPGTRELHPGERLHGALRWLGSKSKTLDRPALQVSNAHLLAWGAPAAPPENGLWKKPKAWGPQTVCMRRLISNK